MAYSIVEGFYYYGEPDGDYFEFRALLDESDHSQAGALQAADIIKFEPLTPLSTTNAGYYIIITAENFSGECHNSNCDYSNGHYDDKILDVKSYYDSDARITLQEVSGIGSANGNSSLGPYSGMKGEVLIDGSYIPFDTLTEIDLYDYGNVAVLTWEYATQLISSQGLDVIIPNTYTHIGDDAFIRHHMTSVVIPDSVTTIGVRSFADNRLTSAVIPNSVTTIGRGAFSSNDLSSIIIPESVAIIGEASFASNKLTSVVIHNGVTSIGDSAFSGNQLTNVDIPDSVTTIGSAAFAYNDLTSVAIPDGVTTIGASAFDDNELTVAIIPETVTTIGNRAFLGNKLTSIAIPNGVTVIEPDVFSQNLLTSVDIPDGVTTIGNMAFSGNQLTSVFIPDSVTSIAGSAFTDNPLETVSVSADALFHTHGIFPDAKIIIRGAPTDLLVSSLTFDENIARLSVIATLSSSDVDGDTHTYTFALGEGDIDNQAFLIDGDQLKIRRTPDFETQSSYSIRLQTTDSDGLTFEKAFTLSVNDLNETVPTPNSEDLNGDGFVDEVTNYQMWTVSGGVELKNRRGRTYSDDTSRKWDLTKSVEVDSGFSILLEGDRQKEGSYRVVFARKDGVISGSTWWKNERLMYREGYEEIFEVDFNGNGVIDLV